MMAMRVSTLGAGFMPELRAPNFLRSQLDSISASSGVILMLVGLNIGLAPLQITPQELNTKL